MASKQLELPIFHYDDPATGSPLVGGWVYTYAAGTSTPQTTYTDSTLSVANTNPVELNGYGNAKIWFDQPLKVEVRSADTLTLYVQEDNISPTGGTSVVFGNFNAILNGSFESDTGGAPDNWTLSAYSGGTIAVDTTAATSGNQSLKFTGTGAGGGTATSTMFDVQVNGEILVEFSYKTSAAASTNVVQVFWYQLDGTASATVSTTVHTDSATNPASFTTYRYSVDVPSDATQATLVITGVSSGGGQLSSNATFDNVSVITEGYLVPDTFGVVGANKVVVTDSNLDATGFRKITGSTSTGYTASFTYTGTTNSDAAVYGNVTGASGNSFAVQGVNASATGYGVAGQATHATGANYGVYGSSASSAGTAGFFTATHTSGTGLALDAAGYDMASASPVARFYRGNYSLQILPRATDNTFNSIVNAGDQVIGSAGAGGAIDTGVLTLAPYATDAVGIRIDSTVDTVTISGTTYIATANITSLGSVKSSGTQNIADAASWVIPAGLYNFAQNSSTGAFLQLYIGGTWVGVTGSSYINGFVYSDGTNMRLYNSSGFTAAIYYQKF